MDLAAVLEKFQQSSLFFGGSFPTEPGDTTVVCEKLVRHATGQDKVRRLPCLQSANNQELLHAMRKDLLWTEARDVWQVVVDPVWAEFHGIASTHGRPVPFLDNLNLCLWVYTKPEKKPVATEGCDERLSRKLLMD